MLLTTVILILLIGVVFTTTEVGVDDPWTQDGLHC